MNKKIAQKKTEELESTMSNYRKEHEEWKKGNLKKKIGFFPIFNPFKEKHLSEISGGALKAYVYLGLHANNSTGECWHSVETMSEFFQVDTRTMKKWIAELESRNLIRRVQKGFKRIANTFLTPYD